MGVASDRIRSSMLCRVCVLLASLPVFLNSWGCISEDAIEKLIQQSLDTSEARVFKGGSGERGMSASKCDDKGENCSAQPGVDLEPVGHARPIPLRPDQLPSLKEERQSIHQTSLAGPRGIFVGEMAAEIVDLQADARLARIDLTGPARRVAVSDDGEIAVVSVRGSPGEPQGLDILDLQTMARSGTTSMPRSCGVHAVAFIPGSHDFFAACRDSSSLHRFAVEDGATGPQQEELSACDTPQDLTFTADGDRGLITCTDTVWVYDVPTQSVAWTVEGFVDARNVAARLDGTRAYIADQDEADAFKLVTINLATFDRMGETQLDGFPTDLFLGPDDADVYALSGFRLDVADSDGIVQSSAEAPLFALTGFAVELPIQ